MSALTIAARLAAALAQDRLGELRHCAVRSAILVLLAVLSVLLALGCLTAAAVIGLSRHTGAWQAALIVGAVLLLLALASLRGLRMKPGPRRPSPETAEALAAMIAEQAGARPVSLVLAALATGLLLGLKSGK
jgi:ascorbate-specific PTS system EIIC-type component UlaA